MLLTPARRAETKRRLGHRARWLSSLALAVCVLSACGDEVYYVCPDGSGAHPCSRAAIAAGDAATSDASGSHLDAGASPADDSAAETSLVEAESLDAGDEVSDASPGCVVDVDCPVPDRRCGTSRCNAGRCETMSAPSGTKVLDVPADCHATICDGAGHSAGAVVARSNAPAPAGPCLVGTCDELGRPGAAPLPAGTACSAGPSGKMCDGAGSCVECNHTRDCAPGLYCDATHRCGSVPCTDLDCGGACPPCGLGKRCRVDGDCQSYACEAASNTCIQSQCLDHMQDGNETDLDCGGGICAGCELGQGCLLDQDCLSQACDATASKCVANQCADHRTDGYETGVDCGGGGCPACGPGQKCKTNFDCAGGHFCNDQKVCQ
jgi:hypothetical protein